LLLTRDFEREEVSNAEVKRRLARQRTTSIKGNDRTGEGGCQHSVRRYHQAQAAVTDVQARFTTVGKLS
jgi:hypothetical protein